MEKCYECFHVTVHEGVAHLQLSRPHKANSLNLSFWKEFPKAIQQLNHSGLVRAMIISAEGEIFCGGLDLQMFAERPEFHAQNALDRETILLSLTEMQQALSCLETLRFPVIAAIHGACIGAGLDLIAACDFSFASMQAQFRIEEINVGMMADVGVLQRLPKIIPDNIARYYAFTGETLTVTEAYRLGLVVKVLENKEQLLQHAFKIAQRIASKPPVAIHGSKRSLVYARDHSVSAALEHTTLLQAAILNGSDIQQSIQARMSKSIAQFDNLHEFSF